MHSQHIQPCLWCEKSAGRCEYSSRLKPVPGWDAKQTSYRTALGGQHFMYKVKDCPKFKLVKNPLRNAQYPRGIIKQLEALAVQMCGIDGGKYVQYGFSAFFSSNAAKSAAAVPPPPPPKKRGRPAKPKNKYSKRGKNK